MICAGLMVYICQNQKIINLLNFFLIFLIALNLFSNISFENKSSNEKISKIESNFTIDDNRKINEGNVYFFLMDEMTSYKKYQEFGLDIKKYLNLFEDNGYDYILNSKSSYNGSQYTIGSIFNMNYYKTNINLNENYFFPHSLYNKKKPELLKILRNIGYEFWYLDNQFRKCYEDKFVNCISTNIKNNYFYKILYDEPTRLFFYNTFLSSFLHKIKFSNSKKYFANTEIDKFKLFLENNKNIINKKNNFFFIHNMSPHYPFRDQNCNILQDAFNATIKNYLSSSQCAIEQIKDTIDFISEIDENSSVIFQADHGWSLFNNDGKFNIEGFKVFNMIKLSNKCNIINNNDENFNSVETIRLLMSCIVKKEYNVKNSKYFYVKERNKKNGTKFEEVTNY